MRQLVYSLRSQLDLAKITRDIVDSNGKSVASRVVTGMEQSLSNLAYFPEMVRKRGALGAGLRSWSLKPYIAFYHVTLEAVVILRVRHGRRRLTRKLLAEGANE